MNRIEVKTKAPDKISVGANTEIYINGVLASLVKSFKYEIDARGVGVATVEYYGNVTIDSNVPDITTTPVEAAEDYSEMGNYLVQPNSEE